MKKILLIIIVLLILVGCGKSTKNSINSLKPDIPEKMNRYENGENLFISHKIKEATDGNNWLCINGNVDIKNNEIYLSNNAIIEYDDIYLEKGINLFSFEADQNVTVKVQVLDDEDKVVIDDLYNEKHIEFNTEIKNTCYSAKIVIEIVDPAIDEVTISDFKIERSTKINNIHINQIGYNVKQRKVAIFPGHQGNHFYVKSVIDDSIKGVFSLSNIMESKYTDEYVSYGDFTEFDSEGCYYLESSFGYKSYAFEIKKDIYDSVLSDVLKSYTIQRCGIAITDELSNDMSHALCHEDSAYTYYHDEFIDTIGGWHDAGDYGRYVDTGVKALSDMLLAYIDNSKAFNDETNIINSYNGQPDILDEIKYELDWLMKLQEESGGVHSTVSSMQFADIVTPDKDDKKIILFDVSPISTAEFSAVTALASYVFKDIDSEYSKKCLSASEKAFYYARYNTTINKMPGEYQAGLYSSTDLNKYLYYASISLWYATDNNDYYNYAMSVIDVNDYNIFTLNWCPLLLYPSYLILTKADSSYINYDKINSVFFDTVNYTSQIIRSNPYRNNLTDVLTWGSNQYVTDNAMMLMMAYNLSDDMEYYDNATELIDYVFGKNCLNMSFVTGYGTNYPRNIHHRITISKNTEFKGVMVGGPNMSMEDNIMKKIYEGTSVKPQWMYADNINSFSTNETAIQYNSSLIYTLSSTMK